MFFKSSAVFCNIVKFKRNKRKSFSILDYSIVFKQASSQLILIYRMLLTPYLQEVENWPPSGNQILAQFDVDSIVVYQAYNKKIAAAIIKHQNFHHSECLRAGFKLNRMTWIKTNYLWMMYRSGWATKKNQERILAITMTRDGFESIIKESVRSCDFVRLQWDPDHNLDYSKVKTGRRVIQLGLRGEMLAKFSSEYIRRIQDFTSLAIFGREDIKSPEGIRALNVPVERVYTLKDPEIANAINQSRQKSRKNLKMK